MIGIIAPTLAGECATRESLVSSNTFKRSTEALLMIEHEKKIDELEMKNDYFPELR